METLDNQGIDGEEIMISSTMKSYLMETTKWARFLAIVGFVFIGLMVLGGLVVIAFGATMSMGGAPQLGAIGVMYLIFAAIYFFPTYYLLMFANKVKAGLANTDQLSTEQGFENLKSMFKFMGILMIIALSFYALALLIALAGAAMAA